MPIVFDQTSYLVVLGWQTVNFQSGGGATVLGFNGPTESTQNLQDLAGLVNAAAVDLLPELDPNFTQSSVRVESATFSIEDQGAGPGSRSNSDSVPPQVALLDSKSSILKGRRGRGRNYWPSGFLREAEVNEQGIINTPRLQQLDPLFNTFYSAITTGDVFVLAIPQSDREEQVSEPNLPWPEVVARQLDARVASQRRRVRR